MLQAIVDRNALSQLGATQQEPVTGDRARTETERVIVAALANELGVADLTVHANFFDMGADSLMLVQVHAGIEQHLGRTFPLLMLYQHPTVSLLAASLDSPPTPTADKDAATEAEARATRRRGTRRRSRHG